MVTPEEILYQLVAMELEERDVHPLLQKWILQRLDAAPHTPVQTPLTSGVWTAIRNRMTGATEASAERPLPSAEAFPVNTPAASSLAEDWKNLEPTPEEIAAIEAEEEPSPLPDSEARPPFDLTKIEIPTHGASAYQRILAAQKLAGAEPKAPCENNVMLKALAAACWRHERQTAPNLAGLTNVSAFKIINRIYRENEKFTEYSETPLPKAGAKQGEKPDTEEILIEAAIKLYKTGEGWEEIGDTLLERAVAIRLDVNKIIKSAKARYAIRTA